MSHRVASFLSRRTAVTLAGAAVATGFARRVAAQGRFPDRPIRMLLPFSPGGPTDVQMRTLCDRNCSTHPLLRSALKLQASFGDSQEWEILSLKVRYAPQPNQHRSFK